MLNQPARSNREGLAVINRCPRRFDAGQLPYISGISADKHREGNGRTGMLLLHAVAARCGRELDLSRVTRADWYEAARDSMPLRRDGRPSHRPFLPLLNKAVKSV